MKKNALGFLMAMLLVLSALTGCVTVVKIGEEGKLTGEVAFDAGDDVAQFWDSLALPELYGKAVDLSSLLLEADGDFSSVADQYGSYSMGTSGELSFVVKGTGVVTEVSRESSAGYMIVDLLDEQSDILVKLQIGSVYKGTSVRDSLDFISFDDYTNQIEWAQISQNINALIDEQVVAPADVDSLVDRTIEFVGCFTVDKQDEVLIIPVVLTAQ